MGQLSTDMDDPDARPYFLWSENITVARLRDILRGSEGPYLQEVYAGRILREARLHEVWKFLTPQDVVEFWPRVEKHLGRYRGFWEYLLRTWRQHGLLDG
ncbi:MAG: hypothetical protein ACYCW6_23970 [Candidatus Xenobia bacterium]